METYKQQVIELMGEKKFYKQSEKKQQDYINVAYYAGLLTRTAFNKVCREKNHRPQICEECKKKKLLF